MVPHKEFGERLSQERRERSARERRDILQRDIAAAIGTTGATVSRWESGEVMPGDQFLRKLATYFGVTPGWLRYGQEPREAPVRLAQPVDPSLIRPAPRSRDTDDTRDTRDTGRRKAK